MRQSLDLNEAFFHRCIAKIITEYCPQITGRYAAALIGWGSEVLGHDDEYSKRYGWGPRIVLFLELEIYETQRSELSRILHEHVPLTFEGYPTRFTDPTKGPPQPIESSTGFLQIPITTTQRFLTLYLGLENAKPPLTSRDWLLIPEAGLLRLTAGKVFYDGSGELSALRQYFAYLPEDVWRYKLAYQWVIINRDIDLIGLCAERGDTLSARVGIGRIVERIIRLVFLLNRAYHPAYLKWIHRQFYQLPVLAEETGQLLEEAFTTPDVKRAAELFYPVLDQLIEFQRLRLNLPEVDYKRPAKLDRGFFAYNLTPVIDAIRATIRGELSELPFKIGAVDQWLDDQPLLLNPVQLKPFGAIYDWDDPMERLFERNEFEHFL